MSRISFVFAALSLVFGHAMGSMSSDTERLVQDVHDSEQLGNRYQWVKCYDMSTLYVPGTDKVERCAAAVGPAGNSVATPTWCAEMKGECGRETDSGLSLGFYDKMRACKAYCAGNDAIEWRYGSAFDSARATNLDITVGGNPVAPADDKVHQCTCVAKYHDPKTSRTVVEFHDRYFNAEYYAVPAKEFHDMRL